MPAQLKDVKRRVGVTRQLEKITSALQKVSMARLSRDKPALENSKSYTEALSDLLAEVLHETMGADNALVESPGNPARRGRRALVVFGSDKGLCGGFNRTLAEKVTLLAGKDKGDVRLITVGNIVRRRAARAGIVSDHFFQQPLRSARSMLIDEIARIVTGAFERGEYSEVGLIYARFRSGVDHEVVFEELLPVKLGRNGNGDGSVSRATAFEPNAHELVDELVADLVRQMLDVAFLNSLASENAARQMAMNRASQNTHELLGELMTVYRRLRQQSITTEMLEITAAGFAGSRPAGKART